MSALILAIPSKGRLQEQASAFLADCGLALAIEGRGYRAAIAALPEIEVRLVSAGEIARAIREGDVHAGVTGEDVLTEADPDLTHAIPVKRLGFGRADLVLAAPMSWLDVARVADFAEVCADHRARTGARLRIATKYLRLARRFLDARGVSDYRLVESAGATEGAPASGAAEAVIDIATSGATLAANHLKPLADGVILKSQALIAASRAAQWRAPAHAAFAALLDIVEARAHAKQWRLVRVAAGPAGVEPMIARAAELGCKLAGAEESALIELYCPAAKVFAVSAALQDLFGGSVSVIDAGFVFERPNAIYQSFAAALDR